MHTPPPTVKLSAAAKVANWADGLPAIGADPEAPAIDLAHAFDELEAWILRGAGMRACWAIERIAGKYKVGLSARSADLEPAERLTAGQDQELRGAIRNALMIAKFAGYR